MRSLTNKSSVSRFMTGATTTHKGDFVVILVCDINGYSLRIKKYCEKVATLSHTLVFNVKSKLRVNCAETPERVDYEGFWFVEKVLAW